MRALGRSTRLCARRTTIRARCAHSCPFNLQLRASATGAQPTATAARVLPARSGRIDQFFKRAPKLAQCTMTC